VWIYSNNEGTTVEATKTSGEKWGAGASGEKWGRAGASLYKKTQN